MSERPAHPPLRVEQALRLLPDLEALQPLRAMLVSASRPDEQMRWSSLAPYLTVGRRGVRTEELHRRMGQVLHRVTEHLAALYAAYVEALQHLQAGEAVASVKALLGAGRLEEDVGRFTAAAAWYEVAVRLAEGLQDRRAEIETLQALGGLCQALGRHADGARHYQRSLALAEAEFDQAGAVRACAGLGNVALALGEWAGAHAWFMRGMRLAEASGDRLRIGQLLERQGELARRRGDLTAAGEFLRRAREHLEAVGAGEELARTLRLQGQVEAELGRSTAAQGAYREALAWALRAPKKPGLEVATRLSMAELFLREKQYLEADAELRRAEQKAISNNLVRRLVRVYTLMGKLRGLQGDETGFVFFEQAVELCRSLDRAPVMEGHIYREYGVFRGRVGPPDEARAYLEKAREIFESLGESAEMRRVVEDLEQLSA